MRVILFKKKNLFKLFVSVLLLIPLLCLLYVKSNEHLQIPIASKQINLEENVVSNKHVEYMKLILSIVFVCTS